MMISNGSAEPGQVLCDFRIANMPLSFKKHQTIRFALGSKGGQMWPALHCFKQNYYFLRPCHIHMTRIQSPLFKIEM